MTALSCLEAGTSPVMTEGLLRNVSERALTHAPAPKVKPTAELVMENFVLIAHDTCAPGVKRGLASVWHTSSPCSELKGSQCPKESKTPLNCEEIRRDWSLTSQTASPHKAGALGVPSLSTMVTIWFQFKPALPAWGGCVLTSQHSTDQGLLIPLPRCQHQMKSVVFVLSSLLSGRGSESPVVCQRLRPPHYSETLSKMNGAV